MQENLNFKSQKPHAPVLERIERMCVPIPESGCHLFLGQTNRGYGKIKHNGKTRIVTRVMWEETHGPIPDGFFVLHSCDVPACCNIQHLSLGSPLENQRQSVERGRRPDPPMRKLTDDQVRFAREWTGTAKELGELLGVAMSTADRARRRVCFKRLP